MSPKYLSHTIPAAISPLPWITMLGEQIRKKRTGVTFIGLESGNEHKLAGTSGPNYLLQTNSPFTLFEALVRWAAINDYSGYNEHTLAITRHSLKGRKWSHLTLLIITAQYSTLIGQLFLLYLSDTHFKSSSSGRRKHPVWRDACD